MIDCLYTTVRSLHPTAVNYAFLGEHGRKLEPGEEYSQPGDLVATLTTSRWKRRYFKALERALDEGALVLVKDKALHVYDAANDETKTVRANAGSVGLADACWGAYSSSLNDPYDA